MKKKLQKVQVIAKITADALLRNRSKLWLFMSKPSYKELKQFQEIRHFLEGPSS